ncbi:MAG: hemolysin family protein [Chlamydiales bacterium]
MWTILIIVTCILLNAAFAGVEIAFVSVNKALIKSYANRGDEKAKNLLDLKERPERTLSTIQIGITLLGALSAAVGGTAAGLEIVPLLKEHLNISATFAESLAILLVVVPITYLSVVIGEIVPKSLAIRKPYYIASRGAFPLIIFSNILHPFVRICEISTKKVLDWLPFKGAEFEKGRESEYEKILSGYRDLSQKGREYMINLFEIQETKLGEILLDWNQVDYLNKEQSIEEVEEKIIASGHTRMPVIEDDKVIGMINSKEILALTKKGDKNWTQLIHDPILFNSDDSPIPSLNTMQRKRMHMGIVVNENRSPLGIVTIEDIVEEILGEIYDEDDQGSLRRILNRND